MFTNSQTMHKINISLADNANVTMHLCLSPAAVAYKEMTNTGRTEQLIGSKTPHAHIHIAEIYTVYAEKSKLMLHAFCFADTYLFCLYINSFTKIKI